MKILVVDDHALFRDGLKYVLDKLSDGVEVFDAHNCESAIKILDQHSTINLVLVDLQMPGGNGFTLLEHCGAHYPLLPLIIVSGSNSRQDVMHARSSGAMGFVNKDMNSEVMLSALQIVLNGELYFPQLSEQDQNPFFTPRQIEVLTFIVAGLSNKLIAANMNVAEATIKMHITAIMKKLNVTNRTQAALSAREKGLVNLP